MNLSTDRDLLMLEPAVFADVPFIAQQRVHVTDGILAGTTLMTTEADFALAQVDAGSVALIAGVAYEVISRDDASTLTVSLPRTRLADAAIPSSESDATDLDVKVRTFAPQAALVHDSLLRLLGIDTDDPDAALTEDAVISLSVMARLEALGTLERVYSAAAALSGNNDMLLLKAREYGRRFRAAANQAVVLIDTDGDGHANERRHLGLVRLARV